MTVEFISKTPAKFVKIDPQALKMGQTEVVPAVALHIKITAANTTLDMLDKALLPFLYQKGAPGSDAQQVLDGVQVVSSMAELTNAAMELGVLHWSAEQSGCTFRIYQGVTGEQDITLHNCTVRKIKIDCHEGGAVDWGMQVYTSDVDQETMGALGVLKSLERDIELTAPVAASEQEEFGTDEESEPELTPGQALENLLSGGGE